jgi:hypothetical protein
LLLVDYDEPEVLEFYLVAQKLVRADDNIYLPLPELRLYPALLPAGFEPGQRFYRDGIALEPREGRLVVLFG